MERISQYDVVIVGGGAVGLAAAVEAGGRERSVLVLDQFDLLSGRGSSGGAERQWRLQYSQTEMARLTLESDRLWAELERAGGRRLVHRTGSLWFGDTGISTNEGQLAAAVGVLDQLGLPYRWLAAPQIEKDFGFARLAGSYEGFYQPDGGMIDVQATLWLLLDLAQREGADLRYGERVLELLPDEDGVTVVSDQRRYRAGHVVIAAGAFTSELLGPLGTRADVHLYEMTTAYFRCREPSADYPTWFAFQEPTQEDSNLFYGFGRRPWARDDLVKVAPDFEVDELDNAGDATGRADNRQVKRTAGWVAEHLPGLDPTPVDPAACLIALPSDPERHLYLGHLPSSRRVVAHTAGWCFKFVPLLGRACVQLALDGRTEYEIPHRALS